MLRIQIFHTVDLFNLKWSAWASKGMREKLIAIHLVMIFPKCGYDKYHRETDFKTSYLKIRLTLLDFLIIIKRICMGSYKDCMDSSGISWLYRYIYEMI